MQRCRVAIATAHEPRPGVQMLLLTENGLSVLLSDGSPDATSSELTKLRSLVPLTRFKAKAGQTLAVQDGKNVLWLVGRGAGGSRSLRRAAAVAAGLVPEGREWSLRLGLASAGDNDLAAAVRSAVEGIQLGTYRYRQSGQTNGDDGPRPGVCHIITSLAKADAVVRRALDICEASLLTRDLVNMPASDLGPEELAVAAEEVARAHAMSVTVLRGDAVAAAGFRMVEAVGRGSGRGATVTIVRTGKPKKKPAIALVGKGVVFDTGGLDLKPAAGMLLMRKDMGGAGTVIGILDAIGRLGIDLPLLAVLPSAENSVGPLAYRPGDILRSYKGLTVQIGNTDAEGRLLLADALAYACEQGSKRIIDFATLTGAARVALGTDLPALFGTDETIISSLLKTGIKNDEPLWRMPLVDDYDAQLDTPHADMCNVSSESRGGAITAALFLRRFVGDTPWSHIDMYGWEDSGKADSPKGANGMLVRTLTDVLEAQVGG